ncbi:MAG: HAMP domain-containing histidine kinase [Clostridia bacterium]|nr:HAMP domain-containing histidine kinase [Clostridia bacterium]
MFKTSFSKYLTAFVIIIFLSFLMLSGIITSIIRSYVSSETEEQIELSVSLISDALVDSGVEDIRDGGTVAHIVDVIEPVINFDAHYNILIADAGGNVIISSLGAHSETTDGRRTVAVNTEEGFGSLTFREFEEHTTDSGESFLVYHGPLGIAGGGRALVYAKSVVTGGMTRGHVIGLSTTDSEDRLVEITRNAVINSSVWVMLAAVIATYFITERIIHPLRTMTGAAKKFGKGDFSARVTVYGHDEVAELGNAFNNMAESLEALEKMRNSFLANISHDLRTPMTTIAGFIDGITSGAIPEEKHEYYLGVISAEVHRLSRLVSQILDVSRLESGERKFNFTDFDIAEMARIILISFEQKIESKRLEVEFNTDEDEMYANADKDAIYQVLYNLCHNAMKFSREGGKFIISIKRTPQRKLTVTVYDEGQSISLEDSRMVFDRFYKTDKSRGLDKSGEGLGLYISKTIIDAHDERIWVEPGEGCCAFSFTLKEGNPVQKRTKQ